MLLKTFVLLAVVGLILPWFSTNQAGFTVGLYDFAEWVSLHPLERSAEVPMLTAFLLRLQVAITIILWLTAVKEIPRLWWLLVLALCCLAQLPPINAVAEWRDPNYLQQFLITLGTLFAALLTRRIHARAALVLAGSVLALASTSVALIAAQGLVAGFNLFSPPTTGAWLYITAMLVLAIHAGTAILRTKQTG